MYELRIEREFSASHAIVIGGAREETHGHNWRVTMVVEGPQLDEDGLLCDFHELERRLDATLAPFHNADLNRTAPFNRVNPTAEQIAAHIATHIATQVTAQVSAQEGIGAGRATLRSVSVTEAPGCQATYRVPVT